MPPLAQDKNGSLLLEFTPGDELTVSPTEQHIPVAFALVVARCPDNKYLMVFDHFRQGWEIPGGGIEPGETPLACAKREFFEETNQQAATMCYIARIKCLVKPSKFAGPEGREEFGGLFVADVDTVIPFTPNGEIERIAMWDRKSPLPGYLNPIDVKLIELVVETQSPPKSSAERTP